MTKYVFIFKSFLKSILLAILNGISQVIFVKSTLGGLAILSIISIADFTLAFMMLIGCTANIVLSIFLGCSIREVTNGISGFSGALCGLASYTVSVHFYAINFHQLIASIMPFIFLNALITQRFGKSFQRKTGLPILTVPYNVSLYLFTLYLSLGSGEKIEAMLEPSPVQNGWLTISDILKAMIINFGQVFFIDDLFFSLCIVLCMTYIAFQTTMYGIYGAFIFIIIASLLGIDHNLILSGSPGYNVVLSATVIALAKHRSRYMSFLMVSLIAIWSTLLSLLLLTYIKFLGYPLLTTPFCIATLSFLLLKAKFTLYFRGVKA